MSADYLSKVGLSLVRQCETRDPIKIAKQIGVEVMFCENFGPLKGIQSHQTQSLYLPQLRS